MNRVVKGLVWLVGIVVVVAGAGLAYLFLTYPNVPAAENITVQATPEKLARGEYLAKHVTGCVDCHAKVDTTKFSQPVIEGTRGAGGQNFGNPDSAIRVLYSKNITPAAIGAWTDGELIRAFTTGVSKNGESLFPIMPYLRYGKLATDDVEAIVAYVRTLKPIDATSPPRELGMPLPIIVRTMPTPASFRPRPAVSDRVAYGEYVINAAACGDCHTPIDDRGQPLPGRDYIGGFVFKLPAGGVVRSANLTPDADSGIGTWTEAQFVDKFKVFDGAPERSLTPQEQRENTVMPWMAYAGMTREDLGAIYTYLRSLKPVVNRIDRH